MTVRSSILGMQSFLKSNSHAYKFESLLHYVDCLLQLLVLNKCDVNNLQFRMEIFDKNALNVKGNLFMPEFFSLHLIRCSSSVCTVKLLPNN